MVSSELSNLTHNNSPMANSKHRNKSSSLFLSDGFLFLAGAFSALILVWGLSSFTTPIANDPPNFQTLNDAVSTQFDPPDPTFYDDPKVGYTMDNKVRNWDEKRQDWLKLHPSLAAGAPERIVMVTGSQPAPCRNPIGDHLLLRFFKNKVDYCRLHGYDIFYNNALLQPKMLAYWAKYPVVRAAMMAHPEAEWIWWVDSDALFTDMDFKLPLSRYKQHNLVVHGWAHLIHDKRSWTGLNAGVFLIRNCQWSLDFMDSWASMGPQTPNYDKWGETLRSTFKDKFFPESDDQTGLAYLIAIEKEKWADRIYLESEYYFEGYWEEILGTEGYAEMREEYLKDAGFGKGSWRRPFITHFTGCQPCSGKYNAMYSAQDCWNGMQKAFNFADNQVMRKYGYVHPDLLDHAVSPLPFHYPPP
uniref:Galactomannan galactosyltransferase 1 n=1 Tax=Cajanus cajan TaxID=3821 RepID=A0A151SC91_CAJCA|nr:Galactomannan galactosyltransferase 1 [Cajanus cajan]KYP52397.1 Galactomannan galactosyltransferase 1 [Cajanus cajan]